jgi:hypothetical protein
MNEEAKQLKKQWQAAEKDAARAKFPLASDKLAELFDVVEAAIDASGCDHSLKISMEWLERRGFDTDAVVQWLHANHGFCDCEVVANVRDHWKANRSDL